MLVKGGATHLGVLRDRKAMALKGEDEDRLALRQTVFRVVYRAGAEAALNNEQLIVFMKVQILRDADRITSAHVGAEFGVEAVSEFVIASGIHMHSLPKCQVLANNYTIFVWKCQY
jgi:hypothetical protein